MYLLFKYILIANGGYLNHNIWSVYLFFLNIAFFIYKCTCKLSDNSADAQSTWNIFYNLLSRLM